MKTFPMFLRLDGRRVVIAGGGEQAAQKTRLMLKTEAEIVVAAEELDVVVGSKPPASFLVAHGVQFDRIEPGKVFP